ncbi:hypothetical protein VOLCADRAFT_90091 [Volvox carteri f. nagariensis]|uniref:Uncharacterized protein n=1 Tax=Volvox carteri f. nagariensis TaxID=3068 RepID=D8TTG3_VOLCA|nr:uncharacterized protein VOLCADRAFT_90091 [Volvox carteri f. nagariensis]EFJ49301.1 hypothetical protein VOLCADRAFT_90091 [Volvox carteri f. nagariensis]|eukprot:XP_002949749.1 hypothetical protein VOLCADRAFT_90091 [Volvox carteri f. nagariensis]
MTCLNMDVCQAARVLKSLLQAFSISNKGHKQKFWLGMDNLNFLDSPFRPHSNPNATRNMCSETNTASFVHFSVSLLQACHPYSPSLVPDQIFEPNMACIDGGNWDVWVPEAPSPPLHALRMHGTCTCSPPKVPPMPPLTPALPLPLPPPLLLLGLNIACSSHLCHHCFCRGDLHHSHQDPTWQGYAAATTSFHCHHGPARLLYSGASWKEGQRCSSGVCMLLPLKRLMSRRRIPCRHNATPTAGMRFCNRKPRPGAAAAATLAAHKSVPTTRAPIQSSTGPVAKCALRVVIHDTLAVHVQECLLKVFTKRGCRNGNWTVNAILFPRDNSIFRWFRVVSVFTVNRIKILDLIGRVIINVNRLLLRIGSYPATFAGRLGGWAFRSCFVPTRRLFYPICFGNALLNGGE